MKNRLMIKDRSTSPSSSSSSTFSQLPHQPPHSRKPKLALLREVFGRGVSLNRICHSFPIDQHFFKFISWFIFASLFSRFHLLLASTSPSQPSISRWGHVFCPAWLQRLILTSYTQKWQRRFLGAAPLQSKWFFFLPKYSVLSLDWRNEETKMAAKSRTNEESVCRMGKNECVFVCTLLKDSWKHRAPKVPV